MDTPPKYSLMEIERRWTVTADALALLAGLPFRFIEDLYLTGTGLRLRRVESPDGRVEFKLTKKYGRCGPCTEPVTNLYLTWEEYELLAALPGHRIAKRRYAVAEGSLDVYLAPDGAPSIFEVEFPSEEDAGRYVPPAFATEEITGREEYYGAVLASPTPLTIQT